MSARPLLPSLLPATLLAAGFAAALLAPPAAAQEVTYLPEDATYCDMFRGLSKVIPGHCAEPGELAAGGAGATARLPPGIKTRGIRIQDEMPVIEPAGALDPTVTAANEEPAVMTDAVEQAVPPEALAIAMRIQFAYDSATLTPEAMRKLDDLADVLNNELMVEKVVEIEGHADAHGPETYNLALSERRALVVRSYLIERHGVAPERLPFVGRGEAEPFDDDAYAAINRRVEFHNITG
jgi:outer membrane protein OmpA-like peptidoglycan-associated protein